MVKVVWTELSVEDLRGIHDYIANNSSYYASITVNRIYKRADLIPNNPNIGRIVPEIGSKEIRKIIIGNYRLIYLIVSDIQVDILRVYHSARYLSKEDLK